MNKTKPSSEHLRDASYSFYFSRFDEVESLDLLDNGAMELDFSSTKRRGTALLDLCIVVGLEIF